MELSEVNFKLLNVLCKLCLYLEFLICVILLSTNKSNISETTFTGFFLNTDDKRPLEGQNEKINKINVVPQKMFWFIIIIILLVKLFYRQSCIKGFHEHICGVATRGHNFSILFCKPYATVLF